MFLFGLDVPLWAILVVCCSVLIYKYGQYPGTIWKKLGIPSPPSAPFIGHMHLMFDQNTGMRFHFDKWMKQYGKIYGVLFFRDPILVVSDVDALKEVMVKDFNNYVDRYLVAYDALWKPLMKKGLFFNRGQDWKRIRRIMSPSFSSGKLKFLTHHINATSLQLVDALNKHVENGTRPKSKQVFSAFSMDVLAGTAFGLELDSQNNINGSFYQHAKGMVTFSSTLKLILGTAGMFPFLGRFFRLFDVGFLNANDVCYFEEQLTRLVCERKADPGQVMGCDFLQFLINAEADSTDDLQGNKKLTTEEIVAQGIVFVLAGYDTTSAALQWSTYELAKNKHIQNRLREEIEEVVGNEKEVTNEHCHKLNYMEAVLNESLRMYPPIVTLTRKAEKATTLKGFEVPAGTGIIIPIYNIGRDPEMFENPDTFNPDRFMDENKAKTNSALFLPFGLGPRQCIGMRLAMVQMKIALVHILREFSIDGVTPENPEIEDFSGLLVPKTAISLTLSKYKV